MADELKPCPFCASRDVEQRETITDAMVACNNCGGRTGFVYLGASGASNAAKLRELRAAWNTRPAPKADSALVGELRDSPEYTLVLNVDTGEKGDSHVRISTDLRDRILAALSDRDVVLERLLRDASATLYCLEYADARNLGISQRLKARIDAALKGGVVE